MLGAPDRGSLTPPHCSDTAMLAYLDGELPRAEMESTRAHVESCWNCRARLATLQAHIEAFLAARAAVAPAVDLDGDQRISQFRERLARHASEVDARLTWSERLREHWQRLASMVAQHRRAALACAVAVCLLVAMFTDVLGTRVSADTVMVRAENYEASSHPRLGQVRRVALRLERIDRRTGSARLIETVTALEDSASGSQYLTAVSDTGATASALNSGPDATRTDNPAWLRILSADEDLPRPLVQYLAAQQWAPSVSVEAFRRLLAGRGESSSSAQKHGSMFTLHFPFAPGHASGIREADLIVDAGTYRPMGMSLFTGSPSDGQEYRLTETALALGPRTSEMALLFAPRDLSKATRLRPAQELPKVTPLSYASSKATTAEVRVAQALHKADACMGEEIHIFPMSDGSLLVQGLVDKAERRDTVRDSVQGLDPALRVQIYLPREIRSGSQLYRPPYNMPDNAGAAHAPSGATLADLSSQRIPLYEQLYQYFSKPGQSPDDTQKQINAFSNEAVTLARQTFLHAWALKKLDLEFPGERIATLAAEDVQNIEQMRQDHRRWIATISHRQAEMLSQVAKIPAKNLAIDLAPASQPDSETLVRLAQEQSELVRSLFTVSTDAPEAQTSLSRLLAVLHRMGA